MDEEIKRAFRKFEKLAKLGYEGYSLSTYQQALKWEELSETEQLAWCRAAARISSETTLLFKNSFESAIDDIYRHLEAHKNKTSSL